MEADINKAILNPLGISPIQISREPLSGPSSPVPSRMTHSSHSPPAEESARVPHGWA